MTASPQPSPPDDGGQSAGALWAIGDLQGCADALDRLLDAIRFDPARDRLLFAGDLINRGPASLATLRRVIGLGDSALAVLGNHDLHCLAVAAGIRAAHADDTLEDVLGAEDRDLLIDWLRRRPLAHAFSLAGQDYLLVHAGVLPQWDLAQSVALADEVSRALCAPDWRHRLRDMYGNEPACWDDTLRGADRLRVIINALTRLRVIDRHGAMQLHLKEGAAKIPPGMAAWFDDPLRRTRAATVIFGHWSTLGLKLTPNLIGLDTGCVWGGQLSAVRLPDRKLVQCDCGRSCRPN